MKRYNILTTFLILILLTGCSKNNKVNLVNYELSINTILEEKIEFILSSDAYDKAKINQEEDNSYTSIEYSLLYDDLEPIFSNHEKFYNKNIKKKNNSVKVNLDYNYTEDEFINSKYIMNCFENYSLVSKDKTLEIDLSGEFYCLNDKNFTIKVNSIFDIKDSNGELINDSYYWYINKDNYKNVNIHHIISRNYEGMAKKVIVNDKKNNNKIILDIIKIVLLMVAFVLLIRYTKKNKNIV